jgi:hypothetical protein
MMFTPNSLDALAVAHAHGQELRSEAAAERLLGTSPTRRAIAVYLRRAADRLDPAALAPRRAFGPETRVKEA